MLSLTREVQKQRTRLHHQHKNWERNYRDDIAKTQNKMFSGCNTPSFTMKNETKTMTGKWQNFIAASKIVS